MAKRRTLKCSKCDRRFSMAAHLARHMNTIHKKKRAASAKRKPGRPKGTAKKQVQRTRAKRVVARRSREHGVSRIFADLRAYRNELETKLRSVRKAMKALGG